MGRLLIVHPCPICNYYVEDEIQEGGSGISGLFLRNHYMLANCRTCRNLVSVLVPNTAQETDAALDNARVELIQMEMDSVQGDQRARDLLPLFREALSHFEDEEAGPVVTCCTLCESTDLILLPTEGAKFDAGEAWLPCPACDEGELLIETTGHWD